MSRTIRALGFTAALAATSLLGGGVASASSADDTREVPPRVERACLRIPNLQLRTERLLTRINADADTRGSLLWLDRQAERARENDRNQLAEVLENRRAVREAAIEVFELRQEELASLADRCRDAGVEL